jgi:hypothetical protein
MRPHMRVRSLSAWNSVMHWLLCGFDTYYMPQKIQCLGKLQKAAKTLCSWDSIPEHGILHLAMKPLHHFSVFIKVEDYFYILSFLIPKKILKSYVLTAYIAPHMHLHAAYATCNAPPHAYSNPYFKNLVINDTKLEQTEYHFNEFVFIYFNIIHIIEI